MQVILNLPNLDVRFQICEFARAMRVVLNHESQNHELNAYLIRNLRYLLRKDKDN